MAKKNEKISKQKKLKYGHVGRPSKEEVKEYQRLRNYKIIGIVIGILLIFSGVFLYLNKDDLSLTAIMGNSVTNSTMKKVQNSNNYYRITFNPDSYKSGYYYQTYTDAGKTNFISYIFNKTGNSSSKYKWEKIQVFNDGKYITTFTTKNKKFKISEKYVGKNLGLKIIMKNKSTNKKSTKYLRMFVTSNLGGKSDCNIFINNTDSVASSFWWPIATTNGKTPQTTILSSIYRNEHKGIDIAPGSNKNVVNVISVYDGLVYKVVNDSKNTLKEKKASNGTYVVIKHNFNGNVYYSYYSHLKYNSVPSNIRVGSKISAGTKIGVMGNTGFSTGVHLDFKLIKGEITSKNYVNPLKYISKSNPYPGSKWICQ